MSVYWAHASVPKTVLGSEDTVETKVVDPVFKELMVLG
jgi:hypothetical protein